MKQLFTILILCAFMPLFVNGQNNKLEQKNGLLDFKFGSSYELYKKDLLYQGDGDDGVKWYKYSGTKHKAILGEEFDELYVGFYKGKLYWISAYFRFISPISEVTFRKNLESLFGEGSYADSDGHASWAYVWSSNSVTMQLDKSQGAKDNESRKDLVTLALCSKPIRQIILNNNF